MPTFSGRSDPCLPRQGERAKPTTEIWVTESLLQQSRRLRRYRPLGTGRLGEAAGPKLPYFFFGGVVAGEDWLRLSISFCFACELALSLLDF